MCDASLEETMQGVARVQVALGKMDGFKFDKKITRYNDIVETAIRYGKCGTRFNEGAAWAGLIEAIESCSPDIPEMYSPEGVRGMVYDWMINSDF